MTLEKKSGALQVVVAMSIVMMSLPALSAEKMIRSADGDVVLLTAPIGRQQTPSTASGHPFASAEQRAAIKPMAWTESPKGANDKPTIDDKIRRPAESKGSGSAPSVGNEMARKSFPEAWKSIGAALSDGNAQTASPRDFSTAVYPNVRYAGNLDTSKWLSAPWNKIGKLYFNIPGGQSSYCTANVASGNSVIVTAAHCIYSRGLGWNYNFVFVPADRFGTAPYGTYGWQSATVLNDWITIGARRHDVGVIRLTNEVSTGQPVVNYVGWLGRSWDWGYEQYTASNGYASNLSTQYTHICEGWSSFEAAEGADVLAQGCDMTYGSSGGGWLIQYQPYSHAGNYLNSVVSGPAIGYFGSAYVGPRFTSNNIVPVCNAIGC